MQVTLCNRDHPEYGVATMMILNLTRGKSDMRVPLRLPATPADIGEAYSKLDEISTNAKQTRIASVISEVGFLDEFFRDKQPECFVQLNELARRINRMFGKPALLTDSRISRFTVPQGWFCYDLRGSDYDPGMTW